MLLILFILLSNCNKVNFLKNSYSSLKTIGEECKKENFNKRSTSYVVGDEKDLDKEDSNEPKKDKEQNITNIQTDYSKSENLLEILNEEKKAFEKIQREKNEQLKLSIDYSEHKTLLETLEEEKKAFKDLNREEKPSYQNNYDYLYGYEKIIGGYENELFC